MSGIEPKPMPIPTNGSCRCGNTTLKITKPPLTTAACHCKNCQKMTSGPYSLSVSVSPDSFEVTKGKPVIAGAKDPSCLHYFCPDCMSWVYTTLPSMPYFVNVRATMLDDVGSWMGRPWLETQTKEKLPWVETGIAKDRSFERWPADFQSVVTGYQGEVEKNGNKDGE